ncbi:retinitis pigmentosa 1-like 1 protein isoform X1 [Clupea harengus]|uniref:Retinitis pigmentosa 1-like 1 protein isoform X1 n=2 Tax=Clupea harengus TaxID=7950 RepID=A0A8M1KQV6_CLUHA|nr:retinitis pigmentosa 1-like 1 protein isoform X1 [Clupea harengus]
MLKPSDLYLFAESHAEVEETALLPNSSLPIQNGGEDRSVLGMLEVRVEKDLRTGATVITSVAPLPPGDHPGVTEVEMVFDDGRKSVRAVRGSLSAAAQPSAEELGQVLNTLAEVGVPALLEVRGLVPPSVEGQGGREEAEAAKEAEAESEEAELEAEAESEDRDQAADSGSSHKSSQELEPEEDAVDSRGESVGDADSVNEKGEETDEHDNVIDTEEEEDEEEEEEMFRPEEGLDPITLTFLGFSQAATDPGQGNQDDGTLVRVERVFVREDSDEEEEGREGEEYSQDHELACPQTEISHTSTSPVLGTHERQPGAEGLAEMADPGLETHERQPGAEGLAEMADPSLETHLATQTDWPQARQGGGDTEEKRHRSTDTEAIDPARAAASGHDPDRGSPEVPLHLLSCPTLGTRTEGAEMEGEMGRGEGAVEKESLDDVFQDVGLEDPQLSPARDPEWQSSCGEPSRAEGVGSPKHKTCQCCSVM